MSTGFNRRVLDRLVLTLVGLVVRTVPVSSADFPLGDGGLFTSMIGDVLGAGFALPATTSYNGGGLPFAYPPLGIYLAAGVGTIFDTSLISLVTWLPVVLASAAVPLFHILAGQVFHDRVRAGVSTFAFAVLPLAFLGPIMGGGVTRAAGQVAAIAAAILALRFAAHPSVRRGITAGIVTGCAILAHPGFGVFAAMTAGLFVWDRSSPALRLRNLGVGVAATAATITPWVAAVVATHGLPTLLAPGGLRDASAVLVSPLTLDFSPGPIVDVVTPLALIGLFLAINDRRWLLPVWLGATLLTDSWSRGLTASLPVAMLAGAGLYAVLERTPRLSTAGHVALAMAATLALSAALIGPQTRSVGIGSVPHAQRDVAEWFRSDTPTDSRAAIVTGQRWWADFVSEWFPALSDRVNVATVQGTEWLGSQAFFEQQRRFDDLQACASVGAGCVREWLLNEGAVDYLYVVVNPGAECCELLAEDIRSAELGTVVYDSDAALVVDVRELSAHP